MKSRGTPDWLVSHQIAIARIAAAGGFSSENVRPFVDLVGRRPIALKQFVEDQKGVFA